MRRVTIQAPFTDGLVTDIPAHMLGPRMAASASNMIIVDGVATRRRGSGTWSGFTLDNPILGLRFVDFALTDKSGLVELSKDGGFAIFGSSPMKFLGSTTSATNLIDYDVLPRCVYRDEVILCDQSGHRGIRRWAGAGHSAAFANEFRQFAGTNKALVAMNTTIGSAEFSYTLPGTNDGGIVALDVLTDSQPGWFVRWEGTPSPAFSSKVSNIYSTSKGTLASAISAGTWASASTAKVQMTGTAYPAVSIYSAGTVTMVQSGSVATGAGTEWVTGDWGDVYPDAAGNLDWEPASMIFTFSGIASHRVIGTVSSDTSMTVNSAPDASTPMQYHITRGLPWKDACVYRGSLCGVGVAQYPNRVYIAPPGWDMESPPGSVPPLRLAATSFNNADPNYFLLDFIDVPSTVDTDPVVALLPSTGPLLVIKGNSLYGIYGDFPNFTQSLISDGAGCIDRRSAFACAYGQFWAGSTGVFRYTPSSGPVDVTQGRINGEWRRLVRAMADGSGFFCAAGEANGKLIVSIGNTARECVLVHDIESGAWDGFQDIPAFVSCGNRAGAGGAADLLVVAPSVDPDATPPAGETRAKRELEYGLMLAGSREAKPLDYGASRPPRMRVSTGTALARNEGIDGLSRMVDVSMSATVEGTSSAGTSTFSTASVDVVTSGGVLGDDATSTNTGMVSIPEPGGGRRRDRVGRVGRLHQLGVDVSSSANNVALATVSVDGVSTYPYAAAIHQLTASFRDSRRRA